MDQTILTPFPSITISEILDIMFVAVLVYTAIVWAQRTRAAFVVSVWSRTQTRATVLS
jgi:hypothetical protein